MRNYFTIYDVIDSSTAYHAGLNESPFYISTVGAPTFINFINIACTEKSITTAAPTSEMTTYTTIVNELWQRYIYPQYFNRFVCYSDDDSAKAYEAWLDKCGNVYSWLASTVDRYGLAITNWRAQRNNLMDTVTTTNTTKFNDTPQGGSDYTSDNYNTTVTTNIVNAEPGTKMARIKEIELNITELFRDWSAEFGRLFVLWSV